MNEYHHNGIQIVENILPQFAIQQLVLLAFENPLVTPAGPKHQILQKVVSSEAEHYRLLHTILTPKAEEIIGLKLFPTYCYARIYKHGSQLRPHIDRPACQHTLSLHIDSDAPWALQITANDGDVVSADLNPGDGLFFMGCENPHWRLPAYSGDWYFQIFFHWVEKTPENAKYYWDGNDHPVVEYFDKITHWKDYLTETV